MSYNRRKFVQSGLMAGAAAIGLPSLGSGQPKKKLEGDKLVLLGVQGGPVIQSFKSGKSASAIVYKNSPFIIDTGYGVTYKLVEAGINLLSLQYVFITHHHSDHNLELGPLLYNAWVAGISKPIHVYGPTGLNDLLRFYWESNRFDIETRIADEKRPDIRKLIIPHEYTEGEVLSTGEVVVTALRNIHPPIKDSYALKFKLGDKVVVFSGDTSYCQGLISFAAGADYLVHEIIYPPAVDAMVKQRPNAERLKESIISHHTPPEEVGKLATEAKVKTLVLNHFVPPDNKTLTEQVWKDAVSVTWKGNIIVGKDLLELPL